MGQANVAMTSWIDAHHVEDKKCGSGRIKVLDFRASAGAPATVPPPALEAESRELGARSEALITAQRALYSDSPVPSVVLPSGHRMPLVGLGTWKAERGQVRAAVHAALRAGYRHIDCAAVYQNEEEVGEALRAALSCGGVRRSDLFICSKLW